MQIISDTKLDFDDVLIRPKRSELGSRANVELQRTFTTRNSKQQITCMPIVASNMSATGTVAMSAALHESDMLTCLHKFHDDDVIVNHFTKHPAAKSTFYTLGSTQEDIDRLAKVIKRVPIERICVDSANGYSRFFCDAVQRVRDLAPTAILMAGNVATPEMTHELITSTGVDIVKIGIGPGSQCLTRMVTGCGYPQLSAIIESADAAHGLNGLICADGGCRLPGDVVKAFGAGADFVMVGNLFAGTSECDGEWETKNGEKVSLKFFGMSSREAMEQFYGGVASYRAAEGQCTQVPYKGPVAETVKEILGGLRSACAYVGASRLKDLSKCTTFVRVNRIK